MTKQQTIAAIATPSGAGGIGIVRLCGDLAFEIAEKIFEPLNNAKLKDCPRQAILGTLKTPQLNDQILCIPFVAPHSYNGLDIVEFHCHGSSVVTRAALDACLQHGARLAENGEFTRLAFLNGKLSLSQAEGLAELISADSQRAARSAYKLFSGSLHKSSIEIENILLDTLTEIEASLDYPEEELELSTKQQLHGNIVQSYNKLINYVSNANASRVVKDGLNVTIVGKTNVGKSSIYNALTDSDRAIVTAISGTTRDMLECSFSLNGQKINLFDTAGIRDTDEIIEKIGIDKSLSSLNFADLILVVFDAADIDSQDTEIVKKISQQNDGNQKNVIVVYNKSDLKDGYSQVCKPIENRVFCTLNVSAKSRNNIDLLSQKIFDFAALATTDTDEAVVNMRHIDAFRRAAEHLKGIVDNAASNIDIYTIDIRAALQAVGEVTGNTASEEVLHRIFAKFCLGK